MKVLVDTCVWSAALRRRQPEHRVVEEFTMLVRAARVQLIGPIRQEILSGIAHLDQFTRLKQQLGAFRDLPLAEPHFERAAEIHNRCRAAGVQGSNTDFLICAVAQIEHLPIFTTDGDFHRYARVTDLRLHQLR